MTTSPAYRRPTVPRTALRELLEATLSWAEPSGPVRSLAQDGVRYRLTPLTAGAGGMALLCEAPHRSPIPDYEQRRRLRMRLVADCRFNLVIFTDAAHSELVWSWRATGRVDERMYRELAFRPGEAWGPLQPVLESIAGSPPDDAPDTEARSDDRSSPMDSAAALLAALAHRIDEEWRVGVPSREWAQAVQDAISAAAGAEGVRACWRALLQSRVHDQDCGDGQRLEVALRAIVPAYEACLQRMDIELGDLRRRRPPPRRDRLSDFARLTSRAGGARDGAARRLFATELALLHNLSGAARGSDAADACRSRLVAHLSTPGCGVGPELLSLRIVTRDHGRRYGGSDDDQQTPHGASGRPPPDGVLAADIRIVRRAVATILRMHLDGALALDELSRAMSAAALRLEYSTAAPLEWEGGGDLAPVTRPAASRSLGLRLIRGECGGTC